MFKGLTIRTKMFLAISIVAWFLLVLTALIFTGIYKDLVFLRRIQFKTMEVDGAAIERLTKAAEKSFKPREQYQTVDILEEHKAYGNAEKVLRNMMKTDSTAGPIEKVSVSRDQIILRLARNSFKAGWLDKAIDRYNQYLLAVPDDYDVRGEFAGILLTVGEKDQSLEQYQKLVKLQSDRIEWLLLLASAATSGYDKKTESGQKYITIADSALRKALLLDDNPLIYKKLVQILSWQERYDQVLIYLRKCPPVGLDEPQFCRMFAEAVASGADCTDDEAKHIVRLAQQGLATPEVSAELLAALARALRQLEQTDLAIRLFEKTIDKHPSDHTTRYELANLFHNSGKYLQAEKHYEILLEVTKEQK